MDYFGKLRNFFGFEERPRICPQQPDAQYPQQQQPKSEAEQFTELFNLIPSKFFSFGANQRPNDAEHYDDADEHCDVWFGKDDPQTFVFSFGTHPGGFFSPFEHHRRGDDDFSSNNHNQPFSDHPDDMFRHFEDMFRGFDELFRSMGMADFPSHPNTPFDRSERGIDSAAPGALRDKMLKQPHSHTGTGPAYSPGGGGTPRGHSPYEDSRTGPSFMDRLLATPDWDSSTHKRMDQDLDDAVKSGNLDSMLGPRTHSPRSSPRFYSPRISPQPFPSQQDPLEPRSEHPKRVSVRTYRNINGNEEERQSVDDEYGNKEETLTRTLDGQTHTTITRSDPSGKQRVTETFTNMDKGQKGDFEERWKWRAGSGPLTMDKRYEDLLRSNMDKAQKETTSDFRKLFRLGFHGFNPSHQDNR